MKSYKDLEIYIESFSLYFETQKLSKELPKFETYELGSQLRRAADSVVTNIVEGYGRRNYKAEFERFLIFSHSSANEVICHLEKIKILYQNHQNQATFLIQKYDSLARKIYRFLMYVQRDWVVANSKSKVKLD